MDTYKYYAALGAWLFGMFGVFIGCIVGKTPLSGAIVGAVIGACFGGVWGLFGYALSIVTFMLLRVMIVASYAIFLSIMGGIGLLFIIWAFIVEFGE